MSAGKYAKYKDKLRGDVATRTAHEALGRKVSKLARTVKEWAELDATRTAAAAAAAAARDPWDTFVTRAELRHALETGELPESWTVTEPEQQEALQLAKAVTE